MTGCRNRPRLSMPYPNRRRSSVCGNSGLTTGSPTRQRPRRVPAILEAGEPAALGLELVDRQLLVVAPGRVHDVVGAAAQRTPGPAVDQVELERRVDADGGMQAGRRLPGAEADAGDPFAAGAGRLQRQGVAVAGDGEALALQALDLDLQALERAVDVAGGAADHALLAHHVPGLECCAQLEGDVALGDVAEIGEAELEVGLEPLGPDRQPVVDEIAADVLEVAPEIVRQHEPVVQPGAEADQRPAVGLLPEPGDQGAQDQLLGEAHPGVRRHLEGAELDQAQAAGRAVGRVQLVDADLGPVGVAGHVDQQVAEDPVDQPGRAGPGTGIGDLAERDLELVELVLARLVEARRLAGRADEQAREQVAEARVVLPVGHQRGQKVGPAQERAVGRRLAADHDMVAAAGADLTAVDQELAGVEARQPGLLVECLGDRDLLRPAVRGVDVDLDHAGVGGDLDHVEPRVGGRRIALEQHGHALLGRRLLDRRDELDELLRTLGRRHEDAQMSVARLDRHRGAHGTQLLLHRHGPRRRLGLAARLQHRLVGRQCRMGGERVQRHHGIALVRRLPGQRRQRQAETDRGIAGHQEQLAAPRLPALAAPEASGRGPASAGSAARSRWRRPGRARTPWPAAPAPWGRRACCPAGRG